MPETIRAGAPARRRTVRYADFVTPRRRRWPWILALVVLVAAAAGGALFLLKGRSGSHRPPPALSSAGQPVANETYQWRRVAIGGGGMITGLSSDASGQTLVARTDVYGAYMWDGEANRWSQMVTAAGMPERDRVQNGLAAGAYEVAVAPSLATRIYMVVRGRFYRSDDGGRHWAMPSAAAPFPFAADANGDARMRGPFMAVDPANADAVLLGTPAAGLWRSGDGGRSWSRVTSVPASQGQAGAPGTGILIWYEQPAGGRPTGRIFALSAGRGMFVSSNGGTSFAPLGGSGAQPLTLQRGAFDRKGSFFGVDDLTKAIWSYRQGRWRNLTSELGLRASDYSSVAANPRADQVVVLDRGGAGYVSNDGGDSWNTITHSARVGDGDPPWLKTADQPYFLVTDLRFDAKTPNRLWAAHGMGVFHADLAPGASHLDWTSQTRGIEELVAYDVIQPPGQSPVFAGLDFGIHVKDDLTAFSTSFGPNRNFIAAQQLDWTPAKPGFVVTNASDTRTTCCAEDGNAVMAGTSTDGGRSWAKFPTLPTPPGTKSDDPWRMSFGTIAVSSGDAGNIVWAPAFNRLPFYTTDGGRSWTPIDLPDAAGDAPGSFPTIWPQRKTLAADKAAPSTFYLYHSGEELNLALQGLWRSRDGGGSWTRVHAGEIAPGSGFAAKLRSVPGHAGHLFFTAAAHEASDTALRRSNDGGASWQVVPGVTHVEDVAFGKAARGAAYPAIYVVGQVGGAYGVWRSIDNAARWQRLVDFPLGSLDQVSVVGADPDVFGRVYIGYGGSGWIWGEPAPCAATAFAPGAASHCAAVR